VASSNDLTAASRLPSRTAATARLNNAAEHRGLSLTASR
jgi:hypothetical protein